MEIVKMILLGLIATLVIMSGVMKLSHNKKIAASIAKVGLLKQLPFLAIAEILFAILMLIPVTRNAGLLLLICYFSGALATDLSHKNPILAPVLFLLLLFVTTWLQNPGFFYA